MTIPRVEPRSAPRAPDRVIERRTAPSRHDPRVNSNGTDETTALDLVVPCYSRVTTTKIDPMSRSNHQHTRCSQRTDSQEQARRVLDQIVIEIYSEASRGNTA